MATALIGTSLNRVDGARARAAANISEFALENVAHGVMVGIGIPSARS